MTSREFCYWLQGYFEIDGNQPRPPEYASSLNSSQVEMIKKHLAMVFIHEIDPSYPNKDKLNEIHGQLLKPDPNLILRC